MKPHPEGAAGPTFAEPDTPPSTTAARIDLDALAENFSALRSAVRREVLAVVKAEAYGHGAPEAARVFLRSGARMLGVASVREGAALRAAPSEPEASLADARILVMSGGSPPHLPAAAERGLEVAVWRLDQAEAFAAAARALGTKGRIHLKVDSGMGRLGVAAGEAVDFLRAASAMEGIESAGLMSHLARADEEEGEAPTRAQFEVMRSLEAALREKGLLPPLLHCANSAGALAYPDAPGGLVRAGIVLYGCPPRGTEEVGVRPAMRWRSAVIQVKNVAAGAPVGYGGTYRRRTAGRIAVVAAGYADGYPWTLSNRSDALVLGRRAPVVGRVSMDMLTLDVSHLEGVREGEEVVLTGRQGEESIRAEELAARARTIPYEILTGVSARVPRVFIRGGRVASRRTLGGEGPGFAPPGDEGP